MQRKRLFLTSLIGILLMAALGATSVRIVNLEEMVQLSDRVFRGTCLSIRPMENVSGLATLEYTFEVTEGVKGTQTGEQVIFRQVRSAESGQRGIPGMPSFELGQDVLVFLYGNSRLGLTSPVGFSQGVFRVRPAGLDGPQVINGVNNRNLMYGEVSPASTSNLTSEEVTLLSQGSGLPLRTLTSVIRKIDRAQGEGARANQ